MDWKTRIPVFLLWVLAVLSSLGECNAEQRIVCYYTNWSVYRPGTAKFSPQNINPYLCTHLIYAFGGFTKDNTLKPFDKYQDIEKGGYAKFTGLKTYNKELKTMLAIGGWNEGSSRFSPMVADAGKRKEFVKNSVKFLRQNHFDGLDLDWEYPAFRDGGKPRDKNNYADLVQELREEFEKESSKTGRPRLLLSMAVPAGIEYIDKGYDVPRLDEYLDFINLLSYDYHSAYEPAANHHSPLYPLEEDNEYNYDTELTIDYTINHLIKNGASPEKIVLGIPTYGRSYTLFNEDATDIGAPADGPGEEGDATREKGYLAYYEICESIAKSDEWQVVQPNPNAMGPYAYRGNQWVGYDDEDIVRAKARYVNEKKLGGIMFWSIDNDDFRGKCHGRPYPLIEAAKEALLAADDKSNSVTRTRHTDDRKKTRTQIGQRIQNSNTIGKKFKTGRRSTTTESTSPKRRSSSTRNNRRSNGRINSRDEDDDENDDSEEDANSLKSAEKPRSRPRPKNTRSKNQSATGGRKKQQNSRGNSDNESDNEPKEEQRSKKITTPEPPTTPDPGTDFKCEDEGFFPHPRDCKKYFWCLDSGPSGLGIVGHQFTCPSGLVFNKAADSCDYPRNVICPKTKVSQGSVTTTKAPITAATSRTTFLHKTQRTTTAKSESEEEYEYYEEEEEGEGEDDVNDEIEDSREVEEEIRSTTTPKPYKTINRSRATTKASVQTTTEPSTATYSTRSHKTTTEKTTSYEDEEDPRVLKELIDLIKKAGGIEQLEKQLLYQEKNSASNAETKEENGKSTPATISRSLYERVLNRQATRIGGGFLGSFSTTQSSKTDTDKFPTKNSRTGFVNGPGGAQFEGLDQVPEVKNLRRTTKHQYVTIERNRQSTSESPTEEEEEAMEEDENDSRDVASSEDRTVTDPSEKKPSNRRLTPSYVNIRRPRPSATTSENDVEVKDEEEVNAEDTEDDDEARKEEPVVHRIVKTEEKSSSPISRYTNAQRFRSTTLRHSVEKEDVPVKSDETSSSTTTTTEVTTVTEEISEVPTTETGLDSLSSSLDSLINLKPGNISRSYESSSEESSSILIPETTTKGSNEVTLALVENSATEILFTTVPASSLSTGNNYDTFTRGPSSPIVSQPRPFGFSRRGRPTTSTSTTASPTTSVTEQTRPKVDSESPKLPTLKELVGLTTILLNYESTTESTRSSETSRNDETTVAINPLRDETNDRGYKNNRVDPNDQMEGADNRNDSDRTLLESAIDKEFIDNDILSSEDIQRRSSTASFLDVAENQINRSADEAEVEETETSMGDERLRRVEVPVKILDDTNGDEIAELVLLRVPESKLNSAIFRPVLRVKILERESENRDVAGKTKVVDLENLPDVSLENELTGSLRSTPNKRRKPNTPAVYDVSEESSDNPSTNRPRSRQRIIKARRRNRPSKSDDENESSSGITESTVPSQVSSSTSRTGDRVEKSTLETTTVTSNSLVAASTTEPRITTLRGNPSVLLKLTNVTRGFYVTRNIDEVSLVTDGLTTSFMESTRDSPVRSDDVTDDTTYEIDVATLKIDAIDAIDTTTSNIDIHSEETPGGETTSLPREEITTREITSPMGSAIFSLEDEKFTTDKLETLTPDYGTTMKDLLDEYTGTWTMSDENVINESKITTIGSWRTDRTSPNKSKQTQTNPTISIESPTTEVSSNDRYEIRDDNAGTKTGGMTEHVTEFLETSGDDYGRSSSMMESPNETSNISQKLKFTVATTESLKMASHQDTTGTTSKSRRFMVTPTTISMTSPFDSNDETTVSQTERSARKSNTNFYTTTIQREVSNRGGIRYAPSAKSTRPANAPSRTGSNSRTTTKSYKFETSRSNVAADTLFLATTTILPGFEDFTTKSTANTESIGMTSELNEIGRNPHRSSRPLAQGRKVSRKTTKSPEIEKTESRALNEKEENATTLLTTENYKITESTLAEDSSSWKTTVRQETENYLQNSSSSFNDHETLRTTSSINNHQTGNDLSGEQEFNPVNPSSTEPWNERKKASTTSVEATFSTAYFGEEETKPFTTQTISVPPMKEYDWTGKTTGPSEIEDRSDKPDETTFTVTNSITTEAYERTRPSKDYPLTFMSNRFEETDSSSSQPSVSQSQENYEPSLNPSTEDPFQSSTTGIADTADTILDQPTTIEPIEGLTNSVDFIERNTGSRRNVDTYGGATTFLEISTAMSTSTEPYDRTDNSMITGIDNLTTYSITESNNGLHGTTITDETDTSLTTMENYDELTQTIGSVNALVTNDLEGPEENRTDFSNLTETTISYNTNSVPWVYQRNPTLDHHQTDIESSMSASTTQTYDKFNTDDPAVYTNSDDQTVSEKTSELTEITNTEGKNQLPTEPNKIATDRSITIPTTPRTTFVKSTSPTIGTQPINEKTDSKEFSSKNDATPTVRRSTIGIPEEPTYSTTDSSFLNVESPAEVRQSKRTRGKVRFTKLSSSSNDSSEQARRPIKQVVVRRRLANRENATKSTIRESNLSKSSNPNKPKQTRISTNFRTKNQRDKQQRGDNKNTDETNQSRSNEVAKLDDRSNDRSSEEKPNLPKSGRRRVVVYRGRPRPERTSTTPESTKTTTPKPTTTRRPGPDEIPDNKKSRRKWRKRVVLKRSRVNIDEDDQTIAETGDVSRVLIDDVKDSYDREFIGSYVRKPQQNDKSSKSNPPVNFDEEVNLFKNSGAFLRRPGTLVRNDGSNRSRSKIVNTSVPTTTPSSRLPSSSAQSIDSRYEIKTADQSVRAQELAVTLSDPPSFDSSTTTGRVGLRKQAGTTRKISTTIAPRAETTTTPRTSAIVRRRQNNPMRNDKSRNLEIPAKPRRPAIVDYDYYVDDEVRLVLKPELKDKLFVTKKGGIRCLDQGNFAHPTSCKKFITCARMVNGQVIGTEYTCPDKLSFDPVGGICNWSAGLGCEEKSST